MSEPQTESQESQEPAGEPVEPTEAPESAELPNEPQEPPEEPGEPTEPQEPEQPTGMTEKELEKARKSLEAENTRHANRISDLIGEEALLLEPCPLCNGFTDGYRFPVVPPPDVIEKVRVAIGMPDLSNYQPAKNAHVCADCAGLGVVLSGSLVPQNVAIDCKTCNASGYVIVPADGALAVAPALSNGAPLSDPMPGVNPDDPAVSELRNRGFTVIPPMAPMAG